METKKQTKTHKIVFVATDEWWQLRQNDFQTYDDFFEEDALDFVAAESPNFVKDCEEAFSIKITRVSSEHTAIRVGDIVVSDGIGSDKFFVREI